MPGLASQGCFISAEAVERVAGQIGETQKATREVSGGFDGKFPRFRTRVGYRSSSVRDVVRCRCGFDIDRFGPPEYRLDNVSRGRVNLAALSELMQIVSLDFEQVGFHCRGARPRRSNAPLSRLANR